jgi:hypothetical protein
MGWATFWATFLQAHLVTLVEATTCPWQLNESSKKYSVVTTFKGISTI